MPSVGTGRICLHKKNHALWGQAFSKRLAVSALEVGQPRVRRRPEMDTNGFYGDTFSNGFGDFYTARKRRPEMDTNGFYGDTFSSGFGDFYTAKKRSNDAGGSQYRMHHKAGSRAGPSYKNYGDSLLYKV